MTLLVVVVPVLAGTSTNTIGLGILALALFAYGRTERMPLAGAGVAVVALQLENAWGQEELTVAVAAALSGLALLAAYELESWAVQRATSASDRVANREQARALLERLGVVAAILAVLVAVTQAIGHHPVLGIVGGLAALGLGGGLLWLMRRPAEAS